METRITRIKAKDTKGVSRVSWLSPLFVVFVFQSPPQRLPRLLPQPPLTHLKITLIMWPAAGAFATKGIESLQQV